MGVTMPTRRGKKNDWGMGAIIIAFGLMLFVMLLILIPNLPFQITEVEEIVLYLASFIVMIFGIILLLKNL